MPKLLKVIQECQRLGQESLLRPYATLPYLSTVLSEVGTWEDCGHVVPNKRYQRGVPVGKQPGLTKLSSDWLHSLSDITTVTLFENNFISATLFCLPAGRELPIHDHPMMHVLTKVIEGELIGKAYDWDIAGHRDALPELVRADIADEALFAKAMAASKTEETVEHNSEGGSGRAPSTSRLPERSLLEVRDLIADLRRLPNIGRHTDFAKTVPNAKVTYKKVFTKGCGVQWTRPLRGGALHSFRAPAASPVAFIDIITPPYYRAATLNIPCTYFEAVIDSDVAGDAAAIRRMVDEPALHMEGWTSAFLLP